MFKQPNALNFLLNKTGDDWFRISLFTLSKTMQVECKQDFPYPYFIALSTFELKLDKSIL